LEGATDGESCILFLDDGEKIELEEIDPNDFPREIPRTGVVILRFGLD